MKNKKQLIKLVIGLFGICSLGNISVLAAENYLPKGSEFTVNERLQNEGNNWDSGNVKRIDSETARKTSTGISVDDMINGSELYEGECGENLQFTLKNMGREGIFLNINGTGEMDNYFYYNPAPPWYGVIHKYGGAVNIKIDSGVTSIGYNAFVGFDLDCAFIESLSLPEGLKRIEGAAFCSSEIYCQIDIPSTVEYIGNRAFSTSAEESTEILKIKFKGNAPTFQDDSAFDNRIVEVYYPADNKTWTSEVMKNYGGSIKWIPYNKKDEVKRISSAIVKLSGAAYKYTGKPQTPSVTVKYGSSTLKKDRDYTVSYSNNIYVGTATVTVTGKGKYTGSVKKNFSIKSPGKVTVKLNPNGGTVNKKALSLSKGSVYGKLPKPILKGNIFTGWYTAKKGGKLIKSSSHVTNATTLYAHWSKAKYKITYNLNGGKNSKKNPTSYTYNATKITLMPAKKTGYTFGGWYSDSKFKKKVTAVTKGSTGNRILYARWVPYTYTISFDGNLSVVTTQMTPMTIKYGMDYKIKANTYKATGGYKFAGWSLKQRGEVVFKDKGDISIASLVEKGYKLKDGTKVKLWAQWKKRNFKITYNLNGGVNPSKVPVTFSAVEKVLLPVPTRTGYTFKGWYSGNKKISVIPLGTIKNISVTAKWEPVTYKIIFDANGGNGKTDNMSCKYDKADTISKNGFTKDNYSFISWNTKQDGSGKTYNEGEEIKNLVSHSATITLYAQWKRRELVIYKYKEGVSKGSIRYVYQLPKVPQLFAEYNGSLAWGKWSSVAGVECGYATQSMALSYIGKDVSPEYLVDGERTNKWTGTGYTAAFLYGISGITADYSPNYTGIDRFLTRFENDNYEGKYSPVIVHYSGSNRQEHTILIIRKISDSQYEMIDTAKNINKQTVTITQDGRVTGTGVTHGGGVVDNVEQYILLD